MHELQPTDSHWPFFDLVVRTPRVELRPPTDQVLFALADLAATGIHDPDTMPFSQPWTDAEPEAVRRGLLQWGWRLRAELAPASWSLGFAVWEHAGPAGATDGSGPTLVGVQDLLRAVNFPTLRQAETGSWIARAHQGRGLGKEMRAAVLHLAFAGLGAEVVTTGAWHDNVASLAVTRSLPYRPDGEERALRRGQADRMLRFRMARSDWEAVRRDDIVISGLEPCLDVLGLGHADRAG